MLCAAACVLSLQAQPLSPGTQIGVRLGQDLFSPIAKVGDSWSGTLVKDVKIDGDTIAHRGDHVLGRVGASNGNRLTLQVTDINGQPVKTDSVAFEPPSPEHHKAIVRDSKIVEGALLRAVTADRKGTNIGTRDMIVNFTIKSS
jgi:hypothetical protein